MLQVKKLNDFFGLLPRFQFSLAHRGGEQQVLPEAGFAVGVTADQQVVQHAGVLKEFDVLKGPGNAQRRHILGRLIGQLQHALRPPVSNAAGRGGVNAADQVEHRGLASAVRADQGENLTLLDVEADFVDRQHAAEAHAQVLGGE